MRGFYCTNSFVKFDYAHLNICMKQTLSICVHTRTHTHTETQTHRGGRCVEILLTNFACGCWLPYIFNPLNLAVVVIIDLPQLWQKLNQIRLKSTFCCLFLLSCFSSTLSLTFSGYAKQLLSQESLDPTCSSLSPFAVR